NGHGDHQQDGWHEFDPERRRFQPEILTPQWIPQQRMTWQSVMQAVPQFARDQLERHDYGRSPHASRFGRPSRFDIPSVNSVKIPVSMFSASSSDPRESSGGLPANATCEPSGDQIRRGGSGVISSIVTPQ